MIHQSDSVQRTESIAAELAANLTGGQLIVSNIVLLRDAKFFKSGGSLTQSGVLSLAGGTLSLGSGTHQFGLLELDGDTYTTNSTISLSPSNACVLRFADSKSITWSNQAVLTIENWKGSVSGSGTQQVIVGSSSSALTAQQLHQIQFHNPAGASGFFPATILSTGEIVPTRMLAFSATREGVVLRWNGTDILQTATIVTGPYVDVTGASSPRTNRFSDPQRFFRLRR